MRAAGIDLVIVGVILYVIGYAAQNDPVFPEYMFSWGIPLSILCFLAAPWLIFPV